LFKAQAICPAWAFYQFRLGAKALKTPSNGLDSMERGSLVHDVLQQFWQHRHFADLRDMHEAGFAQALNLAINSALRDFSETNKSVSKTVLELEHERLYKLIGAWLMYEKARNIAFNIVDCEAEKTVQICGIEVTLKIDRIHQLESGGIEFVDYKTGQLPKMTSWGETRITEPQLPIYATFYDENYRVTGVQFGMVKIAEHSFEGVSEVNFKGEPEKRKPKFIQNFNDWQNLLNHWKISIESIAQEIKTGEAAVKFDDENLLLYCEVTPLLRLPERQLQFERFQSKS
jgi:exodeoxyribonuclease-5